MKKGEVLAEQTYTEDEFKQLLKNLFTEKKRVRQLQRKFQSKLSGANVSDQFLKFKQAFEAKERECQIFAERLGKVKPAIKKLMLQSEEFEKLQEQLRGETSRFEAEKSKLVEKLAESISQSQRQTDVIKDLHKEISSLRQAGNDLKEKFEGLNRELEDKEELQKQLYQLRESSELWQEKQRVLEERLMQQQQQLEESDVAAIHDEYLGQIKALKSELEDSERAKERLSSDNSELAENYENFKRQLKEKQEKEHEWDGTKMKLQSDLQAHRLRLEDVETELHQAQQHLGKKVKESTLLRDQTERQKVQLEEQGVELERLKSQRNAVKDQEDKLRSQLEMWQQRADGLQDQLQEQRDEISDLHKVKKQYDQIKNALNLDE